MIAQRKMEIVIMGNTFVRGNWMKKTTWQRTGTVQWQALRSRPSLASRRNLVRHTRN